MKARRISGAMFAALLGVAVLAVPAVAQGAPRVEGDFTMNGKIVKVSGSAYADDDEGDTFIRKWSFTPRCPEGACEKTKLKRQTSSGPDTLTLTQKKDTVYKSVREETERNGPCKFEIVSKTTVRVTASEAIGAELRAAELSAKYAVKITADGPNCQEGKQITKFEGKLKG